MSKVLIEAKCPDLLPEWLRFVKGVVDSEDLPLSLSREKPQDTALIKRIGGVLSKKILRFLQEMMRKEPKKYKEEFFKEFGAFLKEARGSREGLRFDSRRSLAMGMFALDPVAKELSWTERPPAC